MSNTYSRNGSAQSPEEHASGEAHFTALREAGDQTREKEENIRGDGERNEV